MGCESWEIGTIVKDDDDDGHGEGNGRGNMRKMPKGQQKEAQPPYTRERISYIHIKSFHQIWMLIDCEAYFGIDGGLDLGWGLGRCSQCSCAYK
jgi:hypothetical protein